MPSSPAITKAPHPTISGLQIDSRHLDPLADFLSPGDPVDLALPRTVVTLCSVIPKALVSQSYYQLRGMPVFRIASAFEQKAPPGFKPDPLDRPGKGGYRLLRLTNTVSYLNDTQVSYNEPLGIKAIPRYAIEPGPNPTRGFAFDLVNEWAGGMPNQGEARLGIGIIIGSKPWQRDNEPTDEEIAALHRQNKAFYLYLIKKADIAYASRDERSLRKIPWHQCREALESASMLYDEPLTTHPWYTSLGDLALATKCPACRKTMNSSAYKCAECGEDVCAYFIDRGLTIDKAEYPGVAKEAEFRAKRLEGKKA